MTQESLTLASLPSGSAVFLDANVFIYAVFGDSKFGDACNKLLARIEDEDIRGHTSASVLRDTAHRLSTLEATKVFGWPYQGIARRLRRHADEMKSLTGYRAAIAKIVDSPIVIASISIDLVVRATELSGLHDMLTNDALILAVMEKLRITALVSADSDFDRVPGFTRFAPT
jgi:predicted nucleic acid-binding protein